MQCSGCTGFTSQFTRLEFLDNYDARFVIVTPGPIDEALAYKARVGNKMTWYSTAHSSFGTDMGAPPGGGFQVNVFLRVGDTVYRTYNTQGRGVEQLSHTFALIDLLPYGRQEDWQDSPEGWPQSPTYSRWAPSEASPNTPTAPDQPLAGRLPAGSRPGRLTNRAAPFRCSGNRSRCARSAVDGSVLLSFEGARLSSNSDWRDYDSE
jgi:hypothetical protein